MKHVLNAKNIFIASSGIVIGLVVIGIVVFVLSVRGAKRNKK